MNSRALRVLGWVAVAWLVLAIAAALALGLVVLAPWLLAEALMGTPRCFPPRRVHGR